MQICVHLTTQLGRRHSGQVKAVPKVALYSHGLGPGLAALRTFFSVLRLLPAPSVDFEREDKGLSSSLSSLTSGFRLPAQVYHTAITRVAASHSAMPSQLPARRPAFHDLLPYHGPPPRAVRSRSLSAAALRCPARGIWATHGWGAGTAQTQGPAPLPALPRPSPATLPAACPQVMHPLMRCGSADTRASGAPALPPVGRGAYLAACHRRCRT